MNTAYSEITAPVGGNGLQKAEPWTLYVPDELKGPFVHTGRPRRIGDLLKEITSEAMITRDGGTYVTRLEIIMRYVVEQAQLGNLWCIQFLAERMEGKAVAVIESHSTTGDIRDVPTDQLIDALGAENVEGDLKLRFESAVDAEVRRRLAMIQAAEHMRLPVAAPVSPPPQSDPSFVSVASGEAAPLRAERKRPVRRGLDPLVAAHKRAEGAAVTQGKSPGGRGAGAAVGKKKKRKSS